MTKLTPIGIAKIRKTAVRLGIQDPATLKKILAPGMPQEKWIYLLQQAGILWF
jgi:hypothetical protein